MLYVVLKDTNVVHVDGSIDPVRDIETINLELIFLILKFWKEELQKVTKQARMDKTLAKRRGTFETP